MGLFDFLLGTATRRVICDDGPLRLPSTSVFKSPLSNLAESFVDNVIRDKVSEPAIGSVVYCDLVAGQAEHSGVYVGGHSIVHLNGDGVIERVTPKQFMDRLGGWNTAISIYVSCNGGSPVGSRVAAERARSMIGSQREYSLVFDNCHQFTAGCLSGDFENACNFFMLLKDEVRTRVGGTEWRVWEL